MAYDPQQTSSPTEDDNTPEMQNLPQPKNEHADPLQAESVPAAEQMPQVMPGPTPAKSPAQRVNVMLLTLVLMTALAAGAVGYIIGSNTMPASPTTAVLQSPAAQQTPDQQGAQPSTVQGDYQSKITITEPVPHAGTAEARPNAASFSGESLRTGTVSLEDTLGSPTLLVFWSHW